MNSSSRIGRAIKSLPDLRTLPFLAALCALEACSMWQSWHGARPPVASGRAVTEAPATAENQAPPADPATDASAESAAAAQPAAATNAAPAPTAEAGKPRQALPASSAAKPPPAGGAGEGLSSNDVGYYMDVLQGQLTQAVGRDARIERRGSSIVLLLPLGFDVDSTQLNPAGRQSVRRLAEILSEYRLTVVSVQVSGPDSDPHGSGARLASDRVTALSKYLTHAGVAGKRISTMAEGSSLTQADSGARSLHGVQAELQVSPIVVDASN